MDVQSKEANVREDPRKFGAIPLTQRQYQAIGIVVAILDITRQDFYDAAFERFLERRSAEGNGFQYRARPKTNKRVTIRGDRHLMERVGRWAERDNVFVTVAYHEAITECLEYLRAEMEELP
ncbi:MAG TPA: hypothetical protein VLA12_18305 [Planctomycetaceae bacterium]|nr:hypothetical protein [Planctomycetaceae bacterium]